MRPSPVAITAIGGPLSAPARCPASMAATSWLPASPPLTWVAANRKPPSPPTQGSWCEARAAWAALAKGAVLAVPLRAVTESATTAMPAISWSAALVAASTAATPLPVRAAASRPACSAALAAASSPSMRAAATSAALSICAPTTSAGAGGWNSWRAANTA